MEQNQDTSLFGLNIDPVTKAHLSGAATWAKFLAIIGFIMCGLVVLVGIFAASIFENFSSRYGGMGEMDTRGLGAMVTIIYVLIAVLYFFPCLFLFNFASKMKAALAANDQNNLIVSFQNLKKTFRYLGVLTIIVISFYLLVILIGVASGGFGEM